MKTILFPNSRHKRLSTQHRQDEMEAKLQVYHIVILWFIYEVGIKWKRDERCKVLWASVKKESRNIN